jgi:PAS domain S-box-containing protein
MNFRGRFFQTRVEPLRGIDATVVGVIGMAVDVTERQIAESAVRESEERYRVLFQSNPHPMWVHDLQTRRFLAVNDAAIARYGWSADEFLSMTIDDLRAVDDGGDALETSDAGDGRRAAPLRHRTRGGEILDVEITAHTITFAGRAAQVVLAGDVTERLRAERSLRTSEELNRRLLEAVPGGLVYVSADERIVHVNGEAAEFAGVPIDDLIGRPVQSWEGTTFNEDGSPCPPADYPTRRCLDTGKPQRGRVIGLKRPDGTMSWGVFSSVPTFEPLSGRQSGAVVTFLDITRRKLSEQAVRTSAERYRFLFENNPFPMCLYDRQTLRYLQVNDAAVRQYGYSREEFATMTIADLRPPEDHAAVRSAVARLAPGVENFGFWRHRRKDGTLIDVEITVHTMTLDGRAVVMAMAVDVTERLKAERLLRHRIEFEKLVTGISTRFINLAAEEIDEGVGAALAQIGEFVGADRSYIAMLSEGGDRLVCTHEWCAPGIEPQIDRFREIPLTGLPWFARWLSAPEAPFWRMIDELPPEAAAEREMMDAQRIRSPAVVPMAYRGRTIGLLGFDSVREKRSWTDDDAALLKIVGEIFVNAFQRRRSEDELRKLAGRLSAAEDAERRRVAQDIHDSIGQTLSVVKLNLESAARGSAGRRAEPGSLARSLELLDDLIEQTRSLTFDLYPAMLDDLGLLPTLRWFGEQFRARTGIGVTVTDNGRVPPLPTAVANYLFRAVKELLANAAKHGQAREALVAVHGREDGLRIVVADDGCGFEPTAALAPGRRRGLGLAGIRERVVSLGGRFFVESCPGQGTEVILEVPLERQAAAAVQ